MLYFQIVFDMLLIAKGYAVYFQIIHIDEIIHTSVAVNELIIRIRGDSLKIEQIHKKYQDACQLV